MPRANTPTLSSPTRQSRYGDGASAATRDLPREYRKSREQILRFTQDDRLDFVPANLRLGILARRERGDADGTVAGTVELDQEDSLPLAQQRAAFLEGDEAGDSDRLGEEVGRGIAFAVIEAHAGHPGRGPGDLIGDVVALDLLLRVDVEFDRVAHNRKD